MIEFLQYMGIAFVSSCVLLILSKIIMCRPLRKDKGYYETREAADEARLLEGVETVSACESKGGDSNDDK